MQANLHEYQQNMVAHICSHPNAALWLDMGLGKTLITLTALVQLKAFGMVGKVLVIAPKKVAEATWQDEAAKWEHTSHLRIVSLLGGKKGRTAGIKLDGDIYIINRDTVADLVKEVKNDWFWDTVVIDEASSFKSWQAQRFKALKAIRGRIYRLIELTGTPAPKDLMDLWSQIYLLDKGDRLGRTITAYRQAFFAPDKRNAQVIFSYKPLPFAEDEIHRRLADLCVSMKAQDYIQLPDMVIDDIPVVLDNDAMTKYRKMERDYVLEVGEDELDAGSAAVLRGKLLQLSSGNCYLEDGSVTPLHCCKYDALLELLEQIGDEPVLLFYRFKHEIDQLIYYCAKAQRQAVMLQGADEVRQWNAGKISVLLAHPASCAYGLNLQQGGRHIVWYGLTDSLELYQQANARLHRQGQSKPVMVHRLLCKGTVDEDVADALTRKDKSQEALLAAMKARIKRIMEE